uniref:EF-hand domain-containing protein n=1 Tax=Neobodo designis TaxID=312471 RepID=A0A7S1QCL2_NEODS|mmetsp:Transcript_38394/g.118623  ORF Transcript_38394/g.118623 Transcript_38394/m.118623 type:complete len:807 (+) Transcript_38394:219-2639(+)
MPSQTPQPTSSGNPDGAFGPSTATKTAGGASVSLPPLRTKHAARLAEQRRTTQRGHGAADASTRSGLSTGYRAAPTTGARTSAMDTAGATTATTATRRGHRNPVKQFAGATFSQPNSALPPLQSALPDMSNWRNPDRRHESVGQRMARNCLDAPGRFETPYKCDRLQQPEALRCTPVPNAASDYRVDVLDKPTVLRATVTSLPKSVSPILQHKALRDLTVPDMVRVLQDAARLDGGGDGLSPAQRAERERQREDPMSSADFSMHQLDDFERTVADKLAFGRFLSNKRQRLPVMVLRHFRHQLMEESALVRKLRELPLKAIEQELEALGPRTINATQWNGLMIRLVGDTFSRLDAHTLFSFFDTDTDGDVDQRELCNGFVHLRSKDGPLLSVLHRCTSFLHQNIKDTRLTFISRFELVLMADGITVASYEKLKPKHREQLKAALTEMLGSFSTNKRGEFPFDEVRRAVLRSNAIVKAIKSFTVPREPDLYASPLSVYLRNGETDDGEQPFRLMMSVKAMDKAQRSAAAAAANSAAAGSASQANLLPSGLGNVPLDSSLATSGGMRDLDDGELDSDDSDYEAETVRANGTLGYAAAVANSPTNLWQSIRPHGHVVPTPKAADAAARNRTLSISSHIAAESGMVPANVNFSESTKEEQPSSGANAPPAAVPAKENAARQKSMQALMSFRPPQMATADMLSAVPTKSNLKGGTSNVGTPPIGKRRATIAGQAAVPPSGTSAAEEDLLSQGTFPDDGGSEDGEPERPVPEPGEPVFFTLRGTLYRQVDGEPPQPFWVPGMPTHVNYSEGRV